MGQMWQGGMLLIGGGQGTESFSLWGRGVITVQISAPTAQIGGTFLTSGFIAAQPNAPGGSLLGQQRSTGNLDSTLKLVIEKEDCPVDGNLDGSLCHSFFVSF